MIPPGPSSSKPVSAPPAEEGIVVLEARGISKSFPGVKALDEVRLTVRRGRLHALLGENGAGKSTLINILAGVFPPDNGEVLLDGRPVAFRNPREARDAGVAIIFQELNLVPQLTVAQNLFLGREPLTRTGLIDDARMNSEAAIWLRRLAPELDPRTPVGRLRVAQQQVVEIAKALSLKARVIIMDEPTSALTEQEVAVLFELIGQLKQDGVAIIYITQKLDELAAIADDLTVLRDGRFIDSRPAQEITHEEIVRMIVGRNLSDLYGRVRVETREEVLRVEGLTLTHPVRASKLLVRDVSFHLHRGEVLGLFGLMGAGRTELLETLFGLHPHRASAKIYLTGQPVWFDSPRHAIDAGLVLAPEDRKREGLVLSLSVAANVSLACLKQTERLGFLDAAREADLVGQYVRRLRIKTPSLQQLTRFLSGGNQQKVVLAKWLATRPKVLLLDEPTRGIDIAAKRDVYELIDELVASGLSVVLVSSELPEILAVADRILVMCEGRKTAEFARPEATEENIMTAALPK
jgi:ribose transport system ATP-binding protein